MTTDEILTEAKALNDQERQTFRGQLLAITSIPGRSGKAQRWPVIERNPNPIRPAAKAAVLGFRIGAGLTPLPDDVFSNPDMQKALNNGPTAWVYTLGAPGLYRMARALQLPVMKVGASSVGLRDRVAALGRDQYASRWWKNGVLQAAHGFDRFEAEHPEMSEPRSLHSPVRQVKRALAVRTGGMDGRDFDKALSEELKPFALHIWIQSGAGLTHCRRLGLDPSEFIRFTSYEFGPEKRLPMATELYVGLQSRFDGDRLADICERIVARYMGLI